MRRTLLSVCVQAGGASLRERKSPGDFPNPDRERRRALNLTLYVYFYAFSLISCIFLCYLLYNCSIFYVLHGVKSLSRIENKQIMLF